ncbi:MAG TPA: RNA polymerase sigma factor [Candidatus Polarisedimenticolaceae bacterium]|nr:RNA polymerase sigma factor [Candidatus Polarisedimenticolaceae bacterium]
MERTLFLEGHGTVTSDIGELFDRHHARLYRLALRMTWGGDDARDLVQESFLRAIEHRPPDDPVAAERWLVRVLVNLCRDRHRRAVVRRAHAAEAAQEDSHRDADPGMSAAVRDAVWKLPVRQRAVVVLHEIEGHTLAEVAEILGIAAVTARWHHHTALKALRRELS